MQHILDLLEACNSFYPMNILLSFYSFVSHMLITMTFDQSVLWRIATYIRTYFHYSFTKSKKKQSKNHKWGIHRKFSCLPGKKEKQHVAVNDPLGQTHSPTGSNHYSHLKFVLFCEIFEKSRRTYRCTDNTCENSGHYRPWLWVGLMDQFLFVCVS